MLAAGGRGGVVGAVDVIGLKVGEVEGEHLVGGWGL